MKRLITFLLAVIMIISLTACGEKGFPRGKVKDNVYTQESFGITFTAPDGYEFYSDKQIAAVYGTTAEVLNANNAIIYDMQCGNIATNASVSITYENMPVIYGTALDDDSYLTLNLASIRTSYDSVEDVEIKAMDKDTVTVSGKEYNGAYITLDIDNVPFYETIFVAENDGYMMRLTAAAYDEAELQELIDSIVIA